jgi:hypothetical protein
VSAGPGPGSGSGPDPVRSPRRPLCDAWPPRILGIAAAAVFACLLHRNRLFIRQSRCVPLCLIHYLAVSVSFSLLFSSPLLSHSLRASAVPIFLSLPSMRRPVTSGFLFLLSHIRYCHEDGRRQRHRAAAGLLRFAAPIRRKSPK